MTFPLVTDLISKDKSASWFFANQWELARAGALMPRRSAMTARRLVPVLPVLAIYEVRSPEQVMVRLCGTRFGQLVNMDLTGRNLVDLAVGEERRRGRIERWRKMAGVPCGGIAATVVPQPSGVFYHCDALFLPVAPDDQSAPLQYMSVLDEMASNDLTPEIQTYMQRQVQNYPEEFLFVDIGRGVPGR